jgi:hypothetical protein
MLFLRFERPMRRAFSCLKVFSAVRSFSGIKKGPRRALVTRIALFADGLPVHGDAPPKYDNKIAHGDPARLLCFAPNLTPPRVDVKRFHDAMQPSFSRWQAGAWIAHRHQALPR